MKPMAPQWLARTFVEYELLPGLLSLLLPPGFRPVNRPPLSWHEFLSETACNLEHLPDEDMPESADVATYLVRDAWHLVRQLKLVSDDGLTSAGYKIADLHDSSLSIHDSESSYEVDLSPIPRLSPYVSGHDVVLHELLGQQLSACYRGQDDLNMVGLLQRGARLLADSKHIWAAYCPGLLLVEFEALIDLAFIDSARALQLCDDLVVYRDAAMHPYGMPSPDVEPMRNRVDHADAVALFYLNDLELIEDSGPGLSVSRATAILLTFCGLLQEVFPVGPVQCLAPADP